jgi:hypothetical protein
VKPRPIPGSDAGFSVIIIYTRIIPYTIDLIWFSDFISARARGEIGGGFGALGGDPASREQKER